MIFHDFTNHEFKKVAFYLFKRTRVHLNIKITYLQSNSKGLRLSEGGPQAFDFFFDFFFFDNKRPIEMTFSFVNRVPNSIDHIFQN